jgi:hypothetical protein
MKTLHSGFHNPNPQTTPGEQFARDNPRAPGVTLTAARKARKFSTVNRCPDCGERGERKGHMGCQYPQD